MMIRTPLIALIFLVLLQSCIPIFSEMQSAKTVGKGNVEVTPTYSRAGIRESGDSEFVQNNIGVQAAIGVSEKVDMRFRYEFINLDEELGNFHAIGIGPKISLKKDKLAAHIPFGIELTEGELAQVQPTLLYTIQLSEMVEFNSSLKYIWVFDGDLGNPLGINLGLGIGQPGKYMIRPEFGLLYYLDDFGNGHNEHFGIGVTFYPKFSQ